MLNLFRTPHAQLMALCPPHALQELKRVEAFAVKRLVIGDDQEKELALLVILAAWMNNAVERGYLSLSKKQVQKVIFIGQWAGERVLRLDPYMKSDVRSITGDLIAGGYYGADAQSEWLSHERQEGE